jgi:hypothetical protein
MWLCSTPLSSSFCNINLPMLSPDSIDNTAKSKADSERKQGVNDKI